MKNKKKTVTIIAIIGIGLAIIGGIGFYTCYHTWNAATCTRPRTCSICGKTEGESKGHTWSNATCTKPQTCGPYLMKLLAILNISVSEWNSCENIKQEEVL